MSPTALRAAITGVAVVASIAVPWAIHHHEQAKLREQNELVEQQAVKLVKLSAENKRLSDLIAQPEKAASSNDEIRELLRLRNEIGQLHQAVEERNKLRLQNQQLLAAQSNALANSLSAPDPQKVLAYWPKSQLARAGYADPASALETTLHAMIRGDSDALLASVTPEAKSKLTKENWFVHRAAAEEVGAATKQIADSLDPSTGFYLIGQKLVSQDQAVLDVYFGGEGRTRTISMKRIGDEWKFDSLGNGTWP
jgi:hypothetical protein